MLGLERRLGALEHVHQRAFADGKVSAAYRQEESAGDDCPRGQNCDQSMSGAEIRNLGPAQQAAFAGVLRECRQPKSFAGAKDELAA
jgi:hypothetical protein